MKFWHTFGTLARRHVDYAGTHARDLANSVETKLQITPFYLMLSIFKNACAYEAVALILRN